jgi:hypothetical protein
MSNASNFGDVILHRIRMTGGPLHIQSNPMFSGSGGGTTGPPKKPHAPVKKPVKKPKK